MRWLAIVPFLLALAGCYVRRNIIVPPSEHGQLCLRDAMMARDICYLQKRGFMHCDEMFDLERLNCPGAYELIGAAADAGPPESTYTLPGYQP